MTARRTTTYERMTTEELAAATAEFDREMVASRSRALTPAERRTWNEARRKPGRPKRGAGVKVISVSVERGLLARSDALARTLGISRAALIERGLRVVLTAREAIHVTPAQRAELDRRSDALDEDVATGRALGLPWDELVRQLRARR